MDPDDDEFCVISHPPTSPFCLMLSSKKKDELNWNKLNEEEIEKAGAELLSEGANK